MFVYVPVPVFPWQMIAQMQIEAVTTFWTMAFSFYGRPRPKLVVAASNPFVTRSEHRASLSVVR